MGVKDNAILNHLNPNFNVEYRCCYLKQAPGTSNCINQTALLVSKLFSSDVKFVLRVALTAVASRIDYK